MKDVPLEVCVPKRTWATASPEALSGRVNEKVCDLFALKSSPRKVQIVLDLIRNKPVDVAMAILKNTPKAACEYLEKHGFEVTYLDVDENGVVKLE